MSAIFFLQNLWLNNANKRNDCMTVNLKYKKSHEQNEKKK